MAVGYDVGFVQGRLDLESLADRIHSMETMLVGNRGRGGEEGEDLLVIASYSEEQESRIAEFFGVGMDGALADAGEATLDVAESLRVELGVEGYFVFEYDAYDDFVLRYYFK